MLESLFLLVESLIPYRLIPMPTDMQAYYSSIADLLNATSPDAFTPSISQLDALIQSMQVAP